MRKKLLLSLMLLFLCAVPAAKGDEIGELRKQLEEQQQLLLKLQQRLDQMESQQQQQDKQIEQKISVAVEKKGTPESLKWVENVKLFGDLRYRHETIEAENDGKQDTQRNRIRARLGLAAKVNPEADLVFRLASGSADPVSTNQTLGDSFSRKDVWIDWAYFDLHPEAVKGLNVLGGKFATPFYAVGKNQLIWDGDLSPEGIAAAYKLPLSACDELFLNSAALWVEERDEGVDTSLWGAQAGLKHYLDGEKKKQYILGGLGWYCYGNIKGQSNLKSTWNSSSSFFGNSSSGGLFANDYDIFEAFGEYNFQVDKTPVSIFGDFVKNCATETSGDTGWLIGGTLNKAKDPGSWQFDYDYREVQADAVVGALNDSDFIGGGTNGKGHRFSFTYQLAKNLQLGPTYFLNERGNNDNDYRRLQLDVVLKF